MTYVYILQSVDEAHFYVGLAGDLKARLRDHNAGKVPHTSKYGPVADKDLSGLQRSLSRRRLREVPEVRVGQSVCHEAALKFHS